jgi:hypothetical protein
VDLKKHVVDFDHHGVAAADRRAKDGLPQGWQVSCGRGPAVPTKFNVTAFEHAGSEDSANQAVVFDLVCQAQPLFVSPCMRAD